MNVTDPILRVSVVSTGHVQIRPDHEASTWRPATWWLLASRRWTGPRPRQHPLIKGNARGEPPQGKTGT